MYLKILLLYSLVSLVSIHVKAVAKTDEPSTVYVVTWNVAANSPPDQSLKQFLGQISTNELNPDIVIVGLQEVTMNVAVVAKNAAMGDKWTAKFDQALTSTNNYHKVHSESLWGMLLNVYVKIKYQDSITNKGATTVMTGAGGTAGNKGGVLLKFSLNSQAFCIVNSHLPAHDGHVQDRIRDYQKIEAQRAKHCSTASDYMFWLGDLNFRLLNDDKKKLDNNAILAKINANKLEELLKEDELNVNKAAKTIFRTFNEHTITFRPTFKLVKGKGTYNQERRPAWTDRILYTSETGKAIKPTLYTSITQYTESDHYPVQAQFYIKQT